MKLFRRFIFWSHLVVGLTAGLVIAMMAFTGGTMAFSKQLVAWAERDVAIVPFSAAPRQSLDELQKEFRIARPETRLTAITVAADPTKAVIFTAGREDIFHVNPITGDIRPASAPRLRSFLHTMEECHRWLTLSGENRDLGKTITGAAALLFFLLAVSGFYLWWPRSLSWRGFRAIMAFNFKLAGMARDFNWHNVVGFWCLPLIILITLTGVIMSYRWANNALFRLAGTEPPAQEAAGTPPAQPAFEIKRPAPDARPLSHDAVLANAQKEFPQWDVMTLRLGGNQRNQRPPASATNPSETAEKNKPEPGPSVLASDKTESSHASATNPEARHEYSRGSESRRANPQPVTLSIHEPGQWPRIATTTITLNPFTGEILKREAFSDQSAGRRARIWARYLHTGEALGLPGQTLSALAAIGTLFLVYTGFALSWRRFSGKRQPSSAN